MARSRYQDNVIKRYYQNRDTLAIQKLGELVSDLFLCDDPKKAARLWERVAKALSHTDTSPAEIKRLLETRDVKQLSQRVAKLSSTPTPTKSARATAPPRVRGR